MKQTKIVLTGGGSGGHITPLAVLIPELRKANPNVKVIYYGALGDKLARQTLEPLVDKYVALPSGKFRRYGGFSGFDRLKLWKAYLFNLRDFVLIILGVKLGLLHMLIDRPQVVFSKGGYPALSACLAAGLTRSHLITHDSDSVPGLVHKLVARFITTSLYGSNKLTFGPNQMFVGVPIAAAYSKPLSDKQAQEVKQEFGFGPESRLILATGGGGGADALNKAAINSFANLKGSDLDLCMVLLAGKHHQAASELVDSLDNWSKDRIKVLKYSDKMSDLVRAAEIVITRAGATSLAELAAAAKPTIILPNAQLTDRHQVYNSAVYIEKQAALVCPSESAAVDQASLDSALAKLLEDPRLRSQLSKNISELAELNASAKIARVISKNLEVKS